MSSLRILLVSSEVAPFAKTGGLADVAAGLSRYLGRAGHDVRVLMPLYSRLRSSGFELVPHPRLRGLPVQLGGRTFSCSIATCKLPDSDVEVMLVDCPELYERDGIYTSDADEHLRFACLSRVALDLCQLLQWSPDAVHCNDWHTGLLPLYLKAFYSWDELFSGTRSVLTIHNIGYQGVFPSHVLEELGLGDRKELLYQEDLEAGKVNFLKTGIMYADALTTVSETYAREIQTAEYGMGLEGVLSSRSDALFGIVNGVDYGEWDPETDPHIAANYSAADPAPKAENKARLLQEAGLQDADGAPCLGVISRLTYQKGLEVLLDVMPVLLQHEDVRLVALGSGEAEYEQHFEWLAGAFPRKVAFLRAYDEALAHRIEAGSDIFMMPSRYEPCGLNQMYSLRYGAVPVVRRTGGLADTVQQFDPATGEGTGFTFEEFTSAALVEALQNALVVWRQPELWRRLVANGMRRDFSWDRQGRHYAQLYGLLSKR